MKRSHRTNRRLAVPLSILGVWVTAMLSRSRRRPDYNPTFVAGAAFLPGGANLQRQPHRRAGRGRAGPSSHDCTATTGARGGGGCGALGMAVSERRVAVFDGAEMAALTSFLSRQGYRRKGPTYAPSDPRFKKGAMTVVVGTAVMDDGGGEAVRVVGVEAADADDGGDEVIRLDEDVAILRHTAARVPRGVSDGDAVSTLVAAVVGVHCAVPRVSNVGGSGAGGGDLGDDGGGGGDFISGRAVVVGGNDYAVFAARRRMPPIATSKCPAFVSSSTIIPADDTTWSCRGMATLGADVTLVSTGSPKIGGGGGVGGGGRVTVLKPAVGEDEVGFASHVGTFDSLLDTIDDEVGGRMTMGGGGGGFDDEGEDDDDDDDGGVGYGSFFGVLEELRRQNNCRTYISTFSPSQQIVRDAGVIFGPGKAKDYVAKLQKSAQSFKSESKSSPFRRVTAPDHFGPRTLQPLFDAGVIYRSDGGRGGGALVRGWSLKDFWELASWPRDSTGGANVRFGLPVADEGDAEEDEDEEDYDDGLPFALSSLSSLPLEAASDAEGGGGEGGDSAAAAAPNPFVVNLRGVKGLEMNVLATKRDCVLFLSAPNCRTCRYLSPQYSRMARLASERRVESDGDGDGNVMFAKADVSGLVGRELGRLLDVDAVPAFVMFRGGKRYGTTVATTRLPSKKLDKAVKYLRSGWEWDSSAFREDK